jgi:hypothetical protein
MRYHRKIWFYLRNESYGSVNSHGLWACANILTPKTGTGQIRNTIELRYSGTRDPSDEYQTSKKYEIAAKINFRIKKRY